MNAKPVSIMVVCCLLVVAGCQSSSQENAIDGAKVAAVGDEMLRETGNTGGGIITVNIPTHYRFPGVDRAQSAASWVERLAGLPYEDRLYLESINERYFGSLAFNSPAELQRLVAGGYLTPEDWLLAKSMSDEEIRLLAENGNAKAQALYVDRLGNALEAIYAHHPDVDQSESRVSDMSLEAARMSRRMLQESSSPFAAYVFGRTDSLSANGPRLESVAASFKLADDRGDKRASSLLQAFTQQHPDLNGAAVLAAYSYMQRLDRRRRIPQGKGS